jgi:hypothetical protein
MNPFKATGNAITSIMNTVESLTRVAEKTITLAENEIDALDEAQQIRLDEVRDEREILKAQRQAKREELK